MPRPLTATRALAPALLTGTSSEFIGRRALPHVLRERHVVLVFGPEGAGKTTVARRLCCSEAVYVGTRELQAALVARVADRCWSDAFLRAPALILDGPVWLDHRPAAVEGLGQLIAQRSRDGLRTVVCQSDSDGSSHLLVDGLPQGTVVVLGLRLPKGKRGRIRFARRVCDELAIPRIAANGTDDLEPWGYATVIRFLGRWKRDNPSLFD